MWYAALLRFIRRRLVLGIIFTSSFTYCIVSFLKDDYNKNMGFQDIPLEKKPLVWRILQDHNDTSDMTCRNSVQGKFLIVDDRGYVCPRKNVAKTGCCNLENEKTKRYNCHSCNKNNCCVIYEYCVSCCLDPIMRPLLQNILSKFTAAENVLFYSVGDDYEFCLLKCRTGSHSVIHEKIYMDAVHKHCFGDLY